MIVNVLDNDEGCELKSEALSRGMVCASCDLRAERINDFPTFAIDGLQQRRTTSSLAEKRSSQHFLTVNSCLSTYNISFLSGCLYFTARGIVRHPIIMAFQAPVRVQVSIATPHYLSRKAVD